MKKGILILTLLILALFSMSCIYAADAEDAIAISEDAEAMEAAQSDEMTASDDSNAMEESDDEELILEDNDVDKPILGEGASTGSFTDLNDLINNQYGSNDTITLSCNYTFNGTDDDDSGFIHGISINREVTIDGKGCTIDGSQKARIFNIGNGGAVKFLNINFINGKATGSTWEKLGGAIFSESLNCVVESCNFTNNIAADFGGALRAVTAYNCIFTGNTAKYGGAIEQGSAYNCTFTGNTANSGGAIHQGDASYCTFTGNTAGDSGGAISDGSAYNCTFTGNTATWAGGAMMGAMVDYVMYSATLCMFDSNTPDDYRYIRIVEAVLSADDLTTSYKSGDRLLFNLTADNTNYVGFNTTIKIYQYEQEIGTYYALSGEGWIVDLSPGTYNAVLSLDKYEGVTNGTATITVMPNNTFWALNQKINGNDKTEINLTNDYYYDPAYDSAFTEGIDINRPVTINGNGRTIDAKGQARIFYVGGDNVTINNVTFVNGKCDSHGGAIYWDGDNGAVSGSSFTGNNAKDGGAIYWDGDNGAVSGSSFTGNNANWDGGAIFWHGANGAVSGSCFTGNNANWDGGAISWHGANGAVSGSSFIGNNATDDGGAILWAGYNGANGAVSDCIFLNNTAGAWGVIYAYCNDLNMNHCWFGNTADNYDSSPEIGGYSSYDNWLFLNATANPDAIAVSDTSDIIFKLFLYNSTSGNITEYDNAPFENLNLTIASTNGNVSKNTAKLGEIIRYDATNIGTGSVTASIENVAYTIELNIKYRPDLSVQSQEADYSSNTVLTLVYNSSATGTVNITLKGKNGNNYTFTNLALNATILLPEAINADEYVVNVAYSGDNVFLNATANATLTVNKLKTELTASAVTTTYNINKDLVITLKDSTGKALSGFKVTVDLNGAKTYTTDSNGQVKVSTKGLAPKVYTARITFNGNTNYEKSSKDVKVTVKKATPKLTAKKKTFKTSVKTKKYTITLKDNTGKAIKKAQVTLKVKGKTYKATTNSKGKATFKITKLNKKGTFKAVITYKGNKNYKKVTKKANIKVIVAFKTVSRGSKDKATVREIQQALKDNGYYLSYKGHYLMVDGKFNSCTERSVKEFQHDKGLKVTGKVDEKTAKKLGII